MGSVECRSNLAALFGSKLNQFSDLADLVVTCEMASLLLLMMVYAFGFSSAQNYPLNYGPPFAPANDNAFMNYLFLNQLKDPTSAGSQDPKINPYDDDADSF